MIKIVERILKVFADNNLFEEGVELIGSWCFLLYQKHLGVKRFPLRTPDIDFLIPNPFHGKEHLGFIKQLEELGFNYDFNRDGSIYLWNADLRIEFITPEKGRGADNSIKIKKLGLNAIPLRFVVLLLDNPITITEGGIKILVPNPTNFCLHKLIIASRRRKIDKSLKDLQQAICTSVIVDAKDIQKLFISLPKKWKQAIINMLEKSKRELPMLSEEIDKLEFTLQNRK
ncbi:MAG: nucleotidyltransferase domain-containing protein [Candidatus Omnitrophica bacterium]|nr:nucleotidyltransferase domain-containing protein [Candidatus Omnitrophota bacterium]